MFIADSIIVYAALTFPLNLKLKKLDGLNFFQILF